MRFSTSAGSYQGVIRTADGQNGGVHTFLTAAAEVT